MQKRTLYFCGPKIDNNNPAGKHHEHYVTSIKSYNSKQGTSTSTAYAKPIKLRKSEVEKATDIVVPVIGKKYEKMEQASHVGGWK